jgi:hypothetical protein
VAVQSKGDGEVEEEGWIGDMNLILVHQELWSDFKFYSRLRGFLMIIRKRERRP